MAANDWGNDPFDSIGSSNGNTGGGSTGEVNSTMLFLTAIGIVMFLVGGVMKLASGSDNETDTAAYWIPLVVAIVGFAVTIQAGKRIKSR